MSDERTSRPDAASERVIPLHISAAGDGDTEQYLAAVMTQYHARLVYWAQSLVGADDADDVVQDALLRFWRRFQRLPAAARPLDPYPQLARLVHDVASERHRDRSRRQNILARIGGAVTHYTATHISSPFISGVRQWMTPGRSLELRQLDPILTSAINALPERSRDVFILVASEGMTYGQVGQLLGITAAGVRQHMVRANQRLRSRLEREGITRRPRGRKAKDADNAEVVS